MTSTALKPCKRPQPNKKDGNKTNPPIQGDKNPSPSRRGSQIPTKLGRTAGAHTSCRPYSGLALYALITQPRKLLHVMHCTERCSAIGMGTALVRFSSSSEWEGSSDARCLGMHSLWTRIPVSQKPTAVAIGDFQCCYFESSEFDRIELHVFVEPRLTSILASVFRR